MTFSCLRGLSDSLWPAKMILCLFPLPNVSFLPSLPSNHWLWEFAASVPEWRQDPGDPGGASDAEGQQKGHGPEVQEKGKTPREPQLPHQPLHADLHHEHQAGARAAGHAQLLSGREQHSSTLPCKCPANTSLHEPPGKHPCVLLLGWMQAFQCSPLRIYPSIKAQSSTSCFRAVFHSVRKVAQWWCLLGLIQALRCSPLRTDPGIQVFSS